MKHPIYADIATGKLVMWLMVITILLIFTWLIFGNGEYIMCEVLGFSDATWATWVILPLLIYLCYLQIKTASSSYANKGDELDSDFHTFGND